MFAVLVSTAQHPIVDHHVDLRRDACGLCDSMTVTDWLALVGILCTAALTVLTWSYLRGKIDGAASALDKSVADEFREFKRDTLRRFDDAGRETSKAWTYMQGLESKFIREFMSRDTADIRFAEHRRDLDRLNAEIDRVKQHIP